MTTKHLIINVDDLGLHPAVCRAVRRLARAGTVTSTTVMANGPHAAESLALLRAESPEVGVGVHLNVLRGRPLSPPERIPTLVDPKTGLFFNSWKTLFLRYATGRIDPKHVETEWDAQILAVRDMGAALDHLDGEKHTQAFPSWFGIAVKLAARHGLGWVRRPVERGRMLDFSVPGLRLKVLNAFALLHARKDRAACPDLVWGIADQGERLTPEGLTRYLRENHGANVVELVCHPGLPEPGDPPLPAEFGPMRVMEQWAAEFAALDSPGWLEAFKAENIRLARYGDIDPSGVARRV